LAIAAVTHESIPPDTRQTAILDFGFWILDFGYIFDLEIFY